jgi:hypothetical protein
LEEAVVSAADRQILLAELPKGKLGPTHFRFTETAMPVAKEGGVLVGVRTAASAW